jgi:hypothetical protein
MKIIFALICLFLFVFARNMQIFVRDKKNTCTKTHVK